MIQVKCNLCGVVVEETSGVYAVEWAGAGRMTLTKCEFGSEDEDSQRERYRVHMCVPCHSQLMGIMAHGISGGEWPGSGFTMRAAADLKDGQLVMYKDGLGVIPAEQVDDR